jgi:hypothetical protein
MPYSRPMPLITVPMRYAGGLPGRPNRLPTQPEPSRGPYGLCDDEILRCLCVLLTILIVAHSGHLGFDDVSKHQSCVSAGPCWSVPPGAAVLPPRPVSAGRSRPTAPTDIAALWDLPPPDQPPLAHSPSIELHALPNIEPADRHLHLQNAIEQHQPQHTFNQRVPGSSPGTPTTKSNSWAIFAGPPS